MTDWICMRWWCYRAVCFTTKLAFSDAYCKKPKEEVKSRDDFLKRLNPEVPCRLRFQVFHGFRRRAKVHFLVE